MGNYVKPTLFKTDMQSSNLSKEKKVTPVVSRKYKKESL